MKMQKIMLISAVASALVLSACGGDSKKKPKVNNAPTSNNFNFATQAETELKANLLAMDADGDALTFVAVTQPTQGTLMLNANGSFVYTPKADTIGEDAFTFTVSDGQASTTAYTTKITITKLDVAFDDYARKAYAQTANAEPLPLNTRNINQNVTDPTAFDDLLNK